MESNEKYQGMLAQALDAERDGHSGAGDVLPELQGYEITHKLGQGGMGSVYLAQDKALGRDVAIKVFNADGFDPMSLERFQQESRMMAKIEHPNVLSIYGVVSASDTDQLPVCLILEYAAGGDLGQLLKRKGKLTEDEAKAVTLGICAGLSEIHRHSIIHRDLKPANILLTPQGQAKVADLGIAMDQVGETLTMTGSYLGSMAYIAPEQQSANRQLVDARADIWAMGVLMYEMLTGTTPQAVIESDILSPVPRKWKPVIRKCLRKNPGDRYRNVNELRVALENLVSTRKKQWAIGLGVIAIILSLLVLTRSKSPDVPAAENVAEKTIPPLEPAPPALVIRQGEWVDLLASLSAPLSPDQGDWSLKQGRLTCARATRAACLSLPSPKNEALGNDYDISLKVVRNSGTQSVAVYLPTSIGDVTFELDGWNSGKSGVQELDGKDMREHAKVFQFSMGNGREYHLGLEVRENMIRAKIDGKHVYECDLRGKRGSLVSLWNFPRKHQVSLAAWASSMTFSEVKIKIIR